MCSSRADRPSQGQTAPLVLYERTAQTGEISIMVVSSLSRYHNYLYFTCPRWARQLLGAQGSTIDLRAKGAAVHESHSGALLI
jgi:hypothetical protein